MVMNPMFELNDTQAQLQGALSRWLDENVPFEKRGALLATPEAIAPVLRGLGQDLGLLGAGLPEDLGGLAASAAEGLANHLVVLQALGQALLPEPYLSAVVGGGGLLQQLGGEAARAAGRHRGRRGAPGAGAAGAGRPP